MSQSIKIAIQELSIDKSNQQSNVKFETLEKGPKRKYTRKSKADEKAKEMTNQMINEQTNEQMNEQTIETTNRQIIEEKYDQHISELLNQHEGTDKEQDGRSYQICQLEKNRVDNIFEEIMQPLVELYRQEQDSKTIIECVKDAITNTVKYTEIDQQEDNGNAAGINAKIQQITGKLIDSSLMDEDNLCIVDIDIHKDKPIEEIDKIIQNPIDSLPSNVGLVKTAHGGLHIYCNRNFYLLPSNRNVKIAITNSFDIDVFAKMIKYKIENGQETKEIVQNRIVDLNKSIRETKNNQRVTLKYEAVNDWENASHLASLREILDKWNIDIEMSYKDCTQQQQDRIYVEQINKDGAIEQMNDELAQACVDGLKNLEIHNYPQPISMEVSLLSIFCGLYGIANESIRAEGMKNIRQFNKLNANADKNYGQTQSNGERKPNRWILTKILRLWKDGKNNISAINALEQYHSLFEKNAGKKTETAIILQGLQSIGKNVFTNVQFELLPGQSSKNTTDMDDFVGKFNAAIENKMLAIANEMKNFGESRMSNMDALKSIITEYSFDVIEKYFSKHEVENVVNMIPVTYNIFPIKIENNDRRYVRYFLIQSKKHSNDISQERYNRNIKVKS
ncbi:MAG: hypothetical protein EZS28_014971 [Streblomastix strix]|uniref:NrS-1 polymerase-like helicase domain-containing protein n=1 Tax=Streblomastix strix TaxID=222440 RepID=A0A5J4W496_9EUKA|nr:MAG: hypothetical protein EZS28_014971 [Streblomastix strix]